MSTIADLTDDLFNAINDGNVSLAVFIDLKKAFDIQRNTATYLEFKYIQKKSIFHPLSLL